MGKVVPLEGILEHIVSKPGNGVLEFRGGPRLIPCPKAHNTTNFPRLVVVGNSLTDFVAHSRPLKGGFLCRPLIQRLKVLVESLFGILCGLLVCLELLDEFGGGIQPKTGLHGIGGLLAFVPKLAERSAKGLNLAFKVLVVLRLTANVLGHPLCRFFALYRLNLLVNGEVLLQQGDIRFKVGNLGLTGFLRGGLTLAGFLIVVDAHNGLIEVGLLLAGLNKLVELALFIRGDARYGFGLITKFGNVSIVFFDTLHDRGNLIDKGICIISTTALGFLTLAKYFLQRRHTFIVSLCGFNEIGAKGSGAAAHIFIKECAWQTNSATANLAEILLVIFVGEFTRDYVAPYILLLVDRPLVYLCGFLERLIDVVGGGIKRLQHRI